MSGKSKLSSFIAKGKKKIAVKAPAAEVAAPAPLSTLDKATAEAAPAVTLDVVQTKVLEQWGGGEDEELVEETAADLVVESRGGGDDEEDDEIDLPSSQARGKYEWKKKQDELANEENARKEAEAEEARKKEEEEKKKQDGVFLLRRKKVELNMSETAFPTLGPKSLPSSTEAAQPQQGVDGSKKRRKAKSTSSKARETSDSGVAENTMAEKSAERQLTADDIWKVVGKWSASSWPSIALDETACRNRFDANLLKTIASS